MSIHNPRRRNAPVRVRKSVLTDAWKWQCWDQGTTTTGHRGYNYPSWEDAWAAMEKHRRTQHAARTEACWDRTGNDCCELHAFKRGAS